jgi:putative chitinase
MITKENLIQLYPLVVKTPFGVDNLSNSLNSCLIKLGTGKYRIPMFLAQTGEESLEYTHVIENLNYSSDALLKLFPSHFSGVADATNYHRKPEKIANRIYSNRMGNGDEVSGDGWKYRGRGILQITGHDNYKACGDFLKIDLLQNPDLLTSLPHSIDSAIWYWNNRNINKVADLEDITSCTKLINGGVIGLEKRISNYKLAKQILGIT